MTSENENVSIPLSAPSLLFYSFFPHGKKLSECSPPESVALDGANRFLIHCSSCEFSLVYNKAYEMSFNSVLSSLPPLERGRIRMKKVIESSLDLFDLTHFLYNSRGRSKIKSSCFDRVQCVVFSQN